MDQRTRRICGRFIILNRSWWTSYIFIHFVLSCHFDGTSPTPYIVGLTGLFKQDGLCGKKCIPRSLYLYIWQFHFSSVRHPPYWWLQGYPNWARWTIYLNHPMWNLSLVCRTETHKNRKKWDKAPLRIKGEFSRTTEKRDALITSRGVWPTALGPPQSTYAVRKKKITPSGYNYLLLGRYFQRSANCALAVSKCKFKVQKWTLRYIFFNAPNGNVVCSLGYKTVFFFSFWQSSGSFLHHDWSAQCPLVPFLPEIAVTTVGIV